MKTDETTILLATFAIVAAVAGASVRADGAQSATLEQHSMQVMPFDMNKTMHIFRKTPSGGIETIVVKDPSDAANIALIRAHLQKESKLFATGNFSDPAYIHGVDMPGLRTLSSGATRVDVRYSTLPAGAQIAFTTQDTSLVAAIHIWFDAQVRDHGSHATMASSDMPSDMGQMRRNMSQVIGGAMMDSSMTRDMVNCPMHQSMGHRADHR